MLLTARKMIGVDYAYGGHSPDTGFDCSGLVYYAHKVNGIQVPRTAAAQFRFADPVPRDALRPGDLMFFRTSGRKISHVGIYLGPGHFLHAPGTGKHVT
ncbi:MAG: C40 family peptidase, partial [Gammaproteobacteria bacterium]|nr:C40 family peptidase [Gammaproteobacteria bacterium]